MSKLLKNLIAVTVAVLIITISPVSAQAPTQIDKLTTLDNKEEMVMFVGIKAKEYGVSESLMLCLINHENKEWNPTLQSYVIYRGVREDSWGLSQIHIPSNPSVSRQEAQDPKFAIDFMASKLRQGRASMWNTLHYCR